MTSRHIWLLLGCLWTVGVLHAQTTAWAGAPLREVTRLARVAEPPGGLIPYRAGKLWGYADTTGRVVIRPCISWATVQETTLFDHGFAVIRTAIEPGAIQALSGPPAATEQAEPEAYRLLVLNARGELLRVRQAEAAVPQPDGSLRCLPRALALGQRELRFLVREGWQNTGFNAGGFRRVSAQESASTLPPLPPGAFRGEALGAHRVAWVAPASGRRSRGAPQLYALGDQHGHLLTAYRFTDIGPFHEGRAVVGLWDTAAVAAPRGGRAPVANPAGYLDTLGNVVVPAIYRSASAFEHGRAVVRQADRYGIIDYQGRYLLPLQKDVLFDPDESGFIRRLTADPRRPAAAQVRYLPPAGQPGPAPVFSSGGPFYQGRAVVQEGARFGLIDRAGHWVTPLAYQWLDAPGGLRSEPNETGEFQPYDAPADAEDWRIAADIRPRYPAPDARYLVARRQGKIGIVARATGREVVPAAYDSILLNPLYGMASLRRAGRDYLVSLATGRALAATYQGVDFQTVQGRRLYVTRTQPQAWALADTTGQLRTAWLPGTGYPTPQGWLLSHEPQGWTLRDTTGRLALASPTPIEQPEWEELWQQVQQEKAEEWSGSTGATAYWRLPLAASNPYAQGVLVVHDNAARRLRLLDARLHEVGQYALPAPPLVTTTLRSYWHYVGTRDARQYSGPHHEVSSADSLQLVTDTGRRLAPVPGAPWAYFFWFDYPRAWYQHGVLPTTQGYVTRGGRKLWE